MYVRSMKNASDRIRKISNIGNRNMYDSNYCSKSPNYLVFDYGYYSNYILRFNNNRLNLNSINSNLINYSGCFKLSKITKERK